MNSGCFWLCCLSSRAASWALTLICFAVKSFILEEFSGKQKHPEVFVNFAIWPFETCRGSCFSSRRLDVCLHYSHPDFFKNIFFQFHSSDQQWSCQETSRAFAVHTVCVSSVKGCGLEEHMCVCFTPAVQTCLPLTPDDVNLYFFWSVNIFCKAGFTVCIPSSWLQLSAMR